MPLDPKQFLSEAEELHALVIGLSEIVAFWPSWVYRPTRGLKATLTKEYHYYMLGRILGVIFWIILILTITL